MGEGLTTLDTDAELLSVLDAVELSDSLEDFLQSAGLASRQCKMKAVCQIHQDWHQADTIQQMVRMVVQLLSRKQEKEEGDSLVFSWLEAAQAGLGGRCEQTYPDCQDLQLRQSLIQSSF